MQTSNTPQRLNLIIAIALCMVAPTICYITIRLPPVIIIGGLALIGFFFWYFTYLKKPTGPKIIIPLFILAATALQIQIGEEYLRGFSPAISLLFNIPCSEKSFLI